METLGPPHKKETWGYEGRAPEEFCRKFRYLSSSAPRFSCFCCCPHRCLLRRFHLLSNLPLHQGKAFSLPARPGRAPGSKSRMINRRSWDRVPILVLLARQKTKTNRVNYIPDRRPRIAPRTRGNRRGSRSRRPTPSWELPDSEVVAGNTAIIT